MGVTDSEPRDLPALRTGEEDLPSLLAPERAVHERAPVIHSGWQTFASQTEVRGIAASEDGELWVATAGGVLRWRGSERFTRYGSEHGLPSNSLRAVAVDGDGRAWSLDASGAVSYMDGGGWSILALGRAVTCMSTDGLGRVWAGTAEGVSRLDADGGAMRELSFGGIEALDEPPRALAVGDEDDVWMCSATGLWHYDGAAWERRSRRSGLTAICLAADALWVGSREGVTQIEFDHGATRSWPLGMTTALAAADRDVWAATRGWVGRFRDGEWEPAADLRGGSATSIVPIGAHEVCIGTQASLLRGEPGAFRPLSTDTPPDLIETDTLGGLIQALAAAEYDEEIIIWVGTSAGLFELRPAANRWRRVASLRVADVRALLAAEDGVQTGSWASGLRALHAGEVGPALLDEPVLALAPGAARWMRLVGTVTGVYGLDAAGAAELLVTSEELQPGAVVRALAAAPDGRIWIGTTAGLFTYSEHAGPAVVRGELVGADVRALLSPRSPAEEVLVGTERGLYQGGSEVQALAGEEVTALAWDGAGAWVGTARGVIGIARSAHDWAVTARFGAHTSGLAGDRITALTIDPDGGVWVGTSSGLSAYRAT